MGRLEKITMVSLVLFFTGALGLVFGGDNGESKPYTDLNRNGKMDVYEDSTASFEDRISDLISQMTLEEKFAQMGQAPSTHYMVKGEFPKSALPIMLKGESCGTLESPFVYGVDVARTVNKVQRYIIENTRLGIPVLVIAECLHGHMAAGSTIFPQAIGLGSTWNPELVESMGKAIALEASACGVRQALSPVLDLARDARWGRVEETYGEDPYLVSQTGGAFIRGMQGGVYDQANYLPEGSLFSTAKHFVAYGTPESGINLGVVRGGERELRELYLKPFYHAIVELGTQVVMPAYNEYDGIPLHSNRKILYDILKTEWGFGGYVFSDYSGINMLYTFQKTAENLKDAALQALNAGVDLEAGQMDAYYNLPELVKNKLVSEKLIDESVRRILGVKFRAGLFENPFADISKVEKIIHNKDHQKLALELARESIVLLENNKKTLPLKKSIKKIAVIGPNADQVQFGDYSASQRNEDGVTVLAGLKAVGGASLDIKYEKGCDITGSNKKGFADAIKIASQSQVTILVLGGSSATLSGIGWGGGNDDINTCGEGFDRNELGLPGVQYKLLKKVRKVSKKVIVILVNGRPYTLEKVRKNCDALIEAWYPGEQGGTAVAEILFGLVNPSGKLPVSFPKTTGHIPCYYNYKPSGRGFYHNPGTPENPGRDYVFSSPNALYPFGYGLSYTKYNYSNLRLSSKVISSDSSIDVSFTISNRGKMAGKEITQLYIRDEVSSVTTPVLALKRFKKVALEPGESKEVRFTLSPSDLSLIDVNLKEKVESGMFTVFVGSSTIDLPLKREFRVK